MKLPLLYTSLKTGLIAIVTAIGKLLAGLVPKSIKTTLHNETFSREGIERLVATGLDLFISILLLLFPIFGLLLSLAYFLTKDALPFSDGQSVGKHFFGLRVVHKGSLNPITNNYKKSILRGVVFLIPGLNLYDIYLYLTKGERIADVWAGTTVINNRYFIS